MLYFQRAVVIVIFVMVMLNVLTPFYGIILNKDANGNKSDALHLLVFGTIAFFLVKYFHYLWY